MNEIMSAPSVGPEAGFNAATADQASIDAQLAGMESIFNTHTATDPYDISHLDFEPSTPQYTEHGDLIPKAAQTPLTSEEIDAMFAGDEMDFTADDQAFLEASGIAARVQTAEEQYQEQMRRMAFSIGQIVTDASANLLSSEKDDEDGDDVFTGPKVTARVPARN